MKKFANQEKSRTFVTGMRKQGSLDGIILLVISFSVINYVVSRAFACDRPTLLFFIPLNQFELVDGGAPAPCVFQRLAIGRKRA